MYTTPDGFDIKSLGLFTITFILSTGPQGTSWISAVAGFLTSMAALTTVAYNVAKFYYEVAGKQKTHKPHKK